MTTSRRALEKEGNYYDTPPSPDGTGHDRKQKIEIKVKTRREKRIIFGQGSKEQGDGGGSRKNENCGKHTKEWPEKERAARREKNTK